MKKYWPKDKGSDVVSGRFVWSLWKSNRNVEMGRPPFSAAMSVFDDKSALVLEVGRMTDGEERKGIYGLSNCGKLLYVVYCIRNNRIRLISVRENRKLRSDYYEQKKKKTL